MIISAGDHVHLISASDHTFQPGEDNSLKSTVDKVVNLADPGGETMVEENKVSWVKVSTNSFTDWNVFY